MIPGLTSIIIPTYQHAVVLPNAIFTAFAQTAPVEVIVIDDGSTDGTRHVIENYARTGAVRPIIFDANRGPSAARNAGIKYARGEFLMFLDADDLIAPNKIERQLTEMTPETGFVLCDVLIRGQAAGKSEPASKRYDYAGKALDGWISHWLAVANFIPIMSPLIRRSALGDIRFEDAHPEDWPFMYELARVARCRYLPEILATYRKRMGSRNSASPRHPAKRPGVVPPLRLNLGCGAPGALSWHPMPGFVNLDKALGWRFEDGLRDFADGSVAGITVSHALMYVREQDLPAVFAEFARVLQPGGVLRITEDDATNPASSRYGGWKGSESAVTLTDAAMVRRHMERVGFTAHDVGRDESKFVDASLCQAQHGDAPHCFWLEGIRECAVLFSPHNDDEALFSAYTIIRHKPQVVICFGSAGDYGDTDTRTAESREAVRILGGGPVEQWDGEKLEQRMRELDARLRPTRVWAPSAQTSHPDHAAVAMIAAHVFGDRVTAYHTYDFNNGGKVRGEPVPFEREWVERKRRALACYRTQLEHPRARIFFDFDMAEYQE